MEVAEINWADLKASFSYNPSDSVAVLRDLNYNAIEWAPVFLNEGGGEPCVNRDGRWRRVQDVPEFERFEQVRTKKYFDTATLQLI